MKFIIIAFFYVIALSACNSKAKEERLIKKMNEKTFTAISYNYTKYDLYGIAFKDVSLPFNIDEAPSGGSVFFHNSSKMNLDSGQTIYFGEGCCFIWDLPVDKPIRVRVVWNVVYDTFYYDGKSSLYYDERTSKESAPGTRWCQAIVDIQPSTESIRPTTVFLHFLPDGSVQARLGKSQLDAVLNSEQVKLHSNPLPPHQFCKQEIENPFYGIPRRPHME
ncbi:DUF3304 domain-containing protein [Duganella sp. Leaf126]|uniref:DUF3304 domain-containing protein n=1 Tax=Duganella sp. Leaf126 TaxID=1736266 RepID=UPI0009EA83A0|nr:DUF3304 domain-containing protein [Duganella sp. Leaf126]